ncbi:universal stress protein [Promicromonospora sukumoe]|uniref:universal stress protein n=1 Tax=Promicromonospora sukumoe TaxID=88382 RepID=UPI00037DECDA|nr:universal stress protein [Promicromonospora sukumoe]
MIRAWARTTEESSPADAEQRPAPVVVAVDGSDRSAGAVRYAINEARLRGSGMRMVHVVPAPLPESGLWPAEAGDVDYLERAGRGTVNREAARARAAAPDLEIEPVLALGPRVAQLVTASSSGDLMVLGRETRRGAERLVARATTAEVVGRVDLPVTVVPARWQETRIGRIVVGIKTFTSAGELLSHALSTAAARHAAVRVVHAVEVPDLAVDLGVADAYSDDSVAVADRLLEQVVGEWSAVYPTVSVETAVVPGRPDAVLVAAASDADVLMVARHHRGMRHPARLGRTPRAILTACDTPVEVLPLRWTGDGVPLVLESAGEILKN